MKIRYRYFWYMLILSFPLYSLPVLELPKRVVYLHQLVSVFLVLGFFFFLLVSRGKIALYRSNPIYLWLIIFNIFLSLSVINPLLNIGGTSTLIDFFTYWLQIVWGSLLFFVSSQTRFGKRTLQTFVRLYIFIAILVSIFGIVQFTVANFLDTGFFSHLPTRFGFKRSISFFKEPRHFGTFIVTPLGLLTWEMIMGEGFLSKVQWKKLLGIIVYILGILTTLSSSAYAAALVIIGTLFVFIVPKSIIFTRKVLYFSILILIILTFVLIFTQLDINSLLSPLERFLLSEKEISKLMDLDKQQWGFARYLKGSIISLQNVRSHPLLGIGLNQVTSGQLHIILPPFQLLQSIGVFGFLAFFLFILGLVKLGKYLRYSCMKVGNWEDFNLVTLGWIIVISGAILSVTSSGWNYPGVWFWVQLSLGSTILFNLKKRYYDYSCR